MAKKPTKDEIKAKADRAERKSKANPIMGRPTDYCDEITDQICELIADGKSIRQICADDTMPAKATVFKWLSRHEDFADRYARAKECQAELMADDIVDIADNKEGDAARDRLRVDARKWIAAKLLPKKYGEKIALGGAADLPPIKTEARSWRELAEDE